MELIAERTELRAEPAMLVDESETFRNEAMTPRNAAVASCGGAMAFDNACTAPGKQTGMLGAAAMKCSDGPEQLRHRTEQVSSGASLFRDALMMLCAGHGKVRRKQVPWRTRHTALGNGVASVRLQPTEAARGFAIIGNAFLLQFPQIRIAQEGTGGFQRHHHHFNAHDGVSAIGGLI